MNDQKLTRTSRFLSLVLRHKPQTLNIELDPQGWVSVEVLLEAMRREGRPLTRSQLETVVRENDKQRFAFSEDGLRIRANQGHSVEVELGHQEAEPPETLYHGTPEKFVPPIMQQGLQKQKRHHVHLHPDIASARKVGARRGKPVVLAIDAAAMRRDEIVFYVTPNNVWLTDEVPPQYLSVVQ